MSPAVKDVGAESREQRIAPSSLSEFAEQYETVVKERQDLSWRLCQALEEIEAINQIYQQRRLEFDSERTRLNLEIHSLRTQLQEFAKKQAEKQRSNGDSAGVQSVIAAREKLIREEFDKKFQELLVEVRTQKKKYSDQVDQMKKKMSTCMCQASRPF
jgi:hypothetical protein